MINIMNIMNKNKKYILKKTAALTLSSVIAFSTAACGGQELDSNTQTNTQTKETTQSKIDNDLSNKCIAVVDGEIKFVERYKYYPYLFLNAYETHYYDFINDVYFGNIGDKDANDNSDNKIIGSLLEYLNEEQANNIASDNFSYKDWINLYIKIRDDYADDELINNSLDTDIEVDSTEEEIIDNSEGILNTNVSNNQTIQQKTNLNIEINAEDIFIVDTKLCSIGDESDVPNNYYILIKNDNPLCDYNYFNGLFDCNRVYATEDLYSVGYFYKNIHFFYHSSVHHNAIKNINDFFDDKGLTDLKNNKYSYEYLENFINLLNGNKVDKISADKIFVLKTKNENIDIVSNPNYTDVNLDDYYIYYYYGYNDYNNLLSVVKYDMFIDDMFLENIVNKVKVIYSDVEIDISKNSDTIMSLNEFLEANGLNENVLSNYSLGQLYEIREYINTNTRAKRLVK